MMQETAKKYVVWYIWNKLSPSSALLLPSADCVRNIEILQNKANN